MKSFLSPSKSCGWSNRGLCSPAEWHFLIGVLQRCSMCYFSSYRTIHPCSITAVSHWTVNAYYFIHWRHHKVMGPSTVVIAVVIITARQLSGRLLSASINEYLCVSAYNCKSDGWGCLSWSRLGYYN